MSDVAVRGATPQDYPAVARIIGRAFVEDEIDLWYYIEKHDSTIAPAGVRVATVDGQVIACTVVVPRLLTTRAGPRPGALITLVACDPEWQRQGFGGLTVRSALEYCREQGLAVAVLYGHRSYYPRFGFAPVLPRLNTQMTIAEAWEAVRQASAGPKRGGVDVQPELLPMSEEDIPAVAALYHAGLAKYPLGVQRPLDGWFWRYRKDHRRLVGVLRSPAGQVQAYARLEPDNRDPAVGTCPEAAVAAPEHAVPLLAALANAAAANGFELLRLVLPPQEQLVQAAVVLGAEQDYRAASAGMAAVVDWKPILPEGFNISEVAAGQTSGRLALMRGKRQLLTARRELLIQLALGYRGFADLALLPECGVHGSSRDRRAAQAAFERLYPRWTLAPYW